MEHLRAIAHAVAVALALTLSADAVLAQQAGAASPYVIDAELPCVSAEALAARVEGMLERDGAGAPRERVVVDGGPGRLVVRVLVEGEGERSREIARPSGECDDELEGTVAVVVAMLLEGPASAGLEAPPSEHAPPSEQTPTAAAHVSRSSAVAAEPTSRAAPAPPRDLDPVWGGVATGPLLAIGMLPDPSFGVGVHAHVGAPGGASGALGVTVLPFARVDAVVGAELTYASLDARLCAPAFLELPPLFVLACAGPSVGFVRGLGTGVVRAEERFALVFDVAASVSAVFAATNDVALGLEIGGRALVVRPSFSIDSVPERIAVHTPSELVPWLALTLFVGDPRPEPRTTTAPPITSPDMGGT